MRPKTIHRSRLTKNFTTLPNELLQNDSISHLALGLLCRMLSLPPDWETNLCWIYGTRKEGKQAMQVAVKELETLGFLRKTRLSSGKMLWEWFDQPQGVIPSEAFPSDGITTATKNRIKKGVRGSEGSSVGGEFKKERKGGFVPKRTSFHRTRHEYPLTEDAFVDLLEMHGIEYVPDYDGSFWYEIQDRGWVEPDGTPIYDPVAYYKARTEKTFPGKSVQPSPSPYNEGGF